MRGLKLAGLTLVIVFTLASILFAGETTVRLEAELVGPAIGGVEPQGDADFRAIHRADDTVRLRLSVEVEEVNYPDGTMLTVKIEGKPVGEIILEDGAGELDLDSGAGDMVPYVNKGDTVKVFFGMKKILAGVFMEED